MIISYVKMGNPWRFTGSMGIKPLIALKGLKIDDNEGKMLMKMMLTLEILIPRMRKIMACLMMRKWKQLHKRMILMVLPGSVFWFVKAYSIGFFTFH